VGGRGLSAPIADFFQAPAARMFEEANMMPRMLEFMDIGPDLGLPALLVDRGFAATGTAGVEGDRPAFVFEVMRSRQLDENAADFFNLLIFAEEMLIT
jgi:hypothetical protein